MTPDTSRPPHCVHATSNFQSPVQHQYRLQRFLLVQLNERLGMFISLMENERLLEPDARVARSLGALFNPALYPGIGRQLQI